MIHRHALTALLCLAGLSLLAPSSAPAAPEIRAPFTPLIMPKPGGACSTILKLADGALLSTQGNSTVVSRDGGKTWGERRAIRADLPVDAPNTPGVPGGQIMLLNTRDNVLVAVWRDKRIDDWDKVTGELGPKSSADVWTIRSLDGGKTWTGQQKIFTGVCGHPPINFLQVRNGNLVVLVQYYASLPLRCVIRPYVSADNGQTWRGGNIIDLGGHGHHDGAFEPTMVELRDGRVWMLIRTNWDRLWESFSEDGGLHWRTLRPSAIESSSSPPYLTRLSNGQLILFWNRLYPEGATSYKRRGMPYSEVEGSWHREELSVALSADEGATWSKPRIVAREADKWLSYSYVFEPEPGRIWLFSGQGKFAAQAQIADLLAAQ
ncbi:MAG: exo-alpha-sialidase [Opitutae bacterium]|nr:exo-alpha-sialidase [Opitutae bacterium]